MLTNTTAYDDWVVDDLRDDYAPYYYDDLAPSIEAGEVEEGRLSTQNLAILWVWFLVLFLCGLCGFASKVYRGQQLEMGIGDHRGCRGRCFPRRKGPERRERRDTDLAVRIERRRRRKITNRMVAEAVALGVGYGFEEVFELTLSSINAGRSKRTHLLVHWSLSLVIVAALIMHAMCRQRGRERTRALTSGMMLNAEHGIEAENENDYDEDEVDDEEALLNLIEWLETIDDVEDPNTAECPTESAAPYTPLTE